MTTYKVLITGVTGFVSAYLARQLIESGNEVYGDYAFRNYNNTYSINTIVSRAFNHEVQEEAITL